MSQGKRGGADRRFMAMLRMPLCAMSMAELAEALGQESERCGGLAPSEESLAGWVERSEERLGALKGAKEGSILRLQTALGPAAGEAAQGVMRASLERVKGGWGLIQTQGRVVPKSLWWSCAQMKGRLQSAMARELESCGQWDQKAQRRLLDWAEREGADARVIDDDQERVVVGAGEREGEGFAPLWAIASWASQAPLAAELLMRGANPSALGPGGVSPLAALARSHELSGAQADEMARTLLAAGADPLTLEGSLFGERRWGPVAGCAAGARLARAFEEAQLESVLGAAKSGPRALRV